MHTGSPKRPLWRTFLRAAEWIAGVLALLYVALVISRIPAAAEANKTADAVRAIRAQRLTMRDAAGERLPPAPDPAEANATIGGVDANANGIRDDVELAIFKRYPDDAKLRAAALQYAMGLQSELLNVSNQETWVAVSQQEERALHCLLEWLPQNRISTLFSQRNSIRNMILNTPERKKKYDATQKFETSFSLLDADGCDLKM